MNENIPTPKYDPSLLQSEDVRVLAVAEAVLDTYKNGAKLSGESRGDRLFYLQCAANVLKVLDEQ